MYLCAIQRSTLWSVMGTVQSCRLPSVNWWLLKDYTASTVSVAPPTLHALPSVPPLGPQRVEQLNQWIQIRSSPANDYMLPIRIWTRFSTTITTHYYPTISYQAYWIFRGHHSKEVGSIWNIPFYRLREALRVQVVILKLVCVPNRTAKNLNGDKATKRRPVFKHFYSPIARLKWRHTSP